MSLFIVYLLIINIIGFYAMYDDKRRAINNIWRISESTLICIAMIGGSIGVILGMNIFRHKTKHTKFSVGIPAIILLQFILFIPIYK